VIPGLSYLAGGVELDSVKGLMIAASVVWFLSTPVWMGLRDKN
jgi:hypothetical protein